MKKILIVVLLALALPVSAQNVVSIGDFTVNAGGTIRVPVYLNGSTNVAGAQIRLDYIPTVVMAYSDPTLDIGDFTPVFVYNPDNSNNASGFITITTAKSGATGLNGNVKIGYVRLQAVGSPGSSSPLGLTIIALSDPAGNDVTPGNVVNGSFAIPTPITASTSTSTSSSSANPNNAPATAPATPSNGSLPIKGEDALTPAITPALTQTSAPQTVPLLATSPLETLVIIGLLGGIALLVLRKRL